MSYFEMFMNQVLCLIVSIIKYLMLLIVTYTMIKQLSKQELKSRSKPWITSGIRIRTQSIRIKNGLFKKFLKTKSTYYHARFKFYGNKLDHLIKLSKRSYYNFFSIHINNGKRIWQLQGIKQIVQIIKIILYPFPQLYVVKAMSFQSARSYASVLQNFLSEFSLSAHFLASYWEYFP